MKATAAIIVIVLLAVIASTLLHERDARVSRERRAEAVEVAKHENKMRRFREEDAWRQSGTKAFEESKARGFKPIAGGPSPEPIMQASPTPLFLAPPPLATPAPTPDAATVQRQILEKYGSKR